MPSLLKGVGFITGAASGIGKATAFAFARHGVKKMGLGDLNNEALRLTCAELVQEYPGVEVLPLELNVSEEHSIEQAVSKTAGTFGRIDYAINNAGGSGSMALTAEQSLEDWQKLLALNLTGVWMSQRAEIRQMLKQGWAKERSSRDSKGVIVNMASMYGIIGTSMNTPAVAYTTSKHGVIGLTKADAIAYAREGIRINAICPGYVATPLLKAATATDTIKREIERTPIGRIADMDEIADSIVFLASPMSSFMCGAGLIVDGGFTIQ